MIAALYYKTFDGKLHASKEKADTHLDKLHGDIICALARSIVETNGKYVAIIGILDNNLGCFSKLLDIAKDRTVTHGEA